MFANYCPTVRCNASKYASRGDSANLFKQDDESASTAVEEDEAPLPSPRPIRPAVSPLHPIIQPSLSSSPLDLHAASRRSSSAGSTGSFTSSASHKSVRFPSDSNQLATTHLTHSRTQYDRSPIIPSGEDLEMPSCKSAADSWIKCLQRKAKEAANNGEAPPGFREIFSTSPTTYSSGSGITSPTESNAPSLTHDDSSSSESDDVVCSLPVNESRLAGLGMHGRTASLDLFLKTLSHPTTGSWGEDFPMEGADDEGEMDDGDGMSDEDGGRRLGMCGLGKFTRSSLYSEDDCLGGF